MTPIKQKQNDETKHKWCPIQTFCQTPLWLATLSWTEKELTLFSQVSTLPRQPLHIAPATFAHCPGNPNPHLILGLNQQVKLQERMMLAQVATWASLIRSCAIRCLCTKFQLPSLAGIEVDDKCVCILCFFLLIRSDNDKNPRWDPWRILRG